MENSAEFSLMEEVVEQPKADENQQGISNEPPTHNSTFIAPVEPDIVEDDDEMDWMGMSFLSEIIAQNDFNPSQIFETVLPPMATQQEIAEIMPMKVELRSEVLSRNRAIDTKYNCPIFLARGHVDNLPSEPTFVRHFEQLGDFRPNVLWMEEGHEHFFYPKRKSEIDLKGINYLLLESHEVSYNVNFTRYNLFCGKVILVPIKHKLPTDLYVVFSGIKGLALHAMGIPHRITLAEMKMASHELQKPLREYEILKQVLNIPDPAILNYQVPYGWLDNPAVDEKVKQALRNLLPPDTALPKLEYILTEKEAISHMCHDLLQYLPNASAEVKEVYVDLVSQIHGMTDSQIITFYRQLQERIKVGMYITESDGVHQYLKPMKQHLAHHYVLDAHQTLKVENLPMSFHFEGLKYSIEVKSLGDVPPIVGLASFCPFGASKRLQHLAIGFEDARKRDILDFAFVEFNCTLSTSWRSVTTRTKSNTQGFGTQGKMWNERGEIKISYSGLWSFPKCGAGHPWSCLINNQFIAEVVHGTLKPNLVSIIRIPSSLQLPALDHFSCYLDSFNIEEGYLQLRVPFSDNWDISKGVSGLGRVLPLELLAAVTQYPNTFSINMVEEYLLGNEDLRISIRSSKSPKYEHFLYHTGLRYREIAENETPEELYLWMNINVDNNNSSPGVAPLAEEVVMTAGVRNSLIAKSTPDPVMAPPLGLTTTTIVQESSNFGKIIPDLIVGDWGCNAVMLLSSNKRQYALSRCWDLKNNYSTNSLINLNWLTSVPASRGDWYLPDTGKAIPSIFITDNDGRARKPSTLPIRQRLTTSYNTVSLPGNISQLPPNSTQPVLNTDPAQLGGSHPLSSLFQDPNQPVNITVNVGGPGPGRNKDTRGSLYGKRRGGGNSSFSGLPW